MVEDREQAWGGEGSFSKRAGVWWWLRGIGIYSRWKNYREVAARGVRKQEGLWEGLNVGGWFELKQCFEMIGGLGDIYGQ